MALRDIRHDQDVAEDLVEVRRFLSDRGVYPDPAGRYDDDALLGAIRALGWTPQLRRTAEDEWEVWIEEPQSPFAASEAVASDPDRTLALLHALRSVLSWLTPEAEWSLFDEQAAQLLGLSGAEFLQQWQAGALPTDDPRVVHLLLLRPVGR